MDNAVQAKLSRTDVDHLLDYSWTTGMFIWKVDHGDHYAGQLAGFRNKSGYITITIRGEDYPAHELVDLLVGGSPSGCKIVHFNGIKDDNRYANLRKMVPPYGAKGTPLRFKNANKVKRINWVQEQRKWQVKFRVDGIKIMAGRFTDFEKAAIALGEVEQSLGISCTFAEKELAPFADREKSRHGEALVTDAEIEEIGLFET